MTVWLFGCLFMLTRSLCFFIIEDENRGAGKMSAKLMVKQKEVLVIEFQLTTITASSNTAIKYDAL